MTYGKESQREWSKLRLLNLISNAYFGLFSDPLNKPKPYKVKRWLNEYLKRETFRNNLKTKAND